MASNQANEVEDIIRSLKSTPGFKSYIILNNDGIVIKWEQISSKKGAAGGDMPYMKAVQHAHLVLDLCSKAKKYMRELTDITPLPPNTTNTGDGHIIENIRLRTEFYELIAAQVGHFTLIVTQEEGSRGQGGGTPDGGLGELIEGEVA